VSVHLYQSDALPSACAARIPQWRAKVSQYPRKTEVGHASKEALVVSRIEADTLRAAETEEVCYLLNRRACSEKFCRARVSQGMGPNVLTFKSKPPYSLAHDWPERGSCQLTKRRSDGNKKTARAAVGAPFPRICQDCFARLILDRVMLRFATFGAHNSKCLVLPVEVAQSESGNLVGSQTVDCAKEQDSPRADIGSVVAGGRSNESANFRPGKPLRPSVKFWDG
jgi:hypothetical protein